MARRHLGTQRRRTGTCLLLADRDQRMFGEPASQGIDPAGIRRPAGEEQRADPPVSQSQEAGEAVLVVGQAEQRGTAGEP